MTFRSKIWSFLYGFAKGSRGGTWHVPRGTWRHVTNAIVVPALWRIFWCLSRPDRTVRSGAIHKSPWTHIRTDKQARPSCKNPPYPEEISIHQNGLRPFFFITILNEKIFTIQHVCYGVARLFRKVFKSEPRIEPKVRNALTRRVAETPPT